MTLSKYEERLSGVDEQIEWGGRCISTTITKTIGLLSESVENKWRELDYGNKNPESGVVQIT
jgi:hypothetical protein